MKFKPQTLLLFILLIILSCSKQEGCTDEIACNFDSAAESDDGSCNYAEDEGWCDCDGNIEDCYGECGGDAVIDDCGVCNGYDGDKDCAGDCNGDSVEDCNGDCGGTAYINECVCVGGSTGLDVDHCYACADVDGNQYETILLNGRLWMAENLKVTHYNNGDAIPTNHSNSDWENLQSGAYAVYGDDPTNVDTYGYLYNWHAVGDERGICPEGWGLPSGHQLGLFSDELNNYYNDLDGSNAGGHMKEIGFEHWNSPNTGATNLSGFTGLPGGRKNVNGSYNWMSTYAFFWTATNDEGTAHWSELQYNADELRSISGEKELGKSIRCVYGVDEDGWTEWYNINN